MLNRSFLRAGHTPTLLSSFFYFDLSFMVWVLLGSLGVAIAADFGLSPAQKGLMVAIPTLSGALLRVVTGIMVDHIGPKKAGIINQLVVLAGLGLAWFFGVHNYSQILTLGVVLGFAGASFAVALPLVSRWYPAEYQGLALGIAGAGNSGTALASLFAPGLAIKYGWNNVIGMAAIPLLIAFVVFLVFAREAPGRPAAKSLAQYMDVLKTADAWQLMGLYAVTFGGFVGLSNSLTIYFNAEYGLSPVIAGFFTAGCVFAGSFIRPFGGALADRIGGVKTLMMVLALAAGGLVVASFPLGGSVKALVVILFAMLALGVGNGAVFQLAPQRFGKQMGVMTGLVGMTGGVGGFYLASSLGLSKQLTGSYQAGFLIFAALALVALLGLAGVRARWSRPADALAAA